MFHKVGIGLLAALLTSCGGDNTDSGEGSRTLLVSADIGYEDGGAVARISVRRAGQPVTDATVRLIGGDEELLLQHQGDGIYRAQGAGWRNSYRLQVIAGPDGVDHLGASLETPDVPALTSPDPLVAFDPHLVKSGVVEVTWGGNFAMRIRVRTKDYDPGYMEDTGRILISSTYFVKTKQEITLDRENSVDLAGGAPESRMRAHIGTKTDLTIINPFPD